MGKRKIYTDENGKTYQIINGEKTYVKIIDSCIDYFEPIEITEEEKTKQEIFLKTAKKGMLKKIITSLQNTNNKH